MNTTFNGTNTTLDTCVVTEVHDALFEVAGALRGTPSDLVHTLTPYGMLLSSVVLCFFGLYAMRSVVGIAAFGAGLVGTVRLLRLGGTDAATGGLAMSCDVATVVVLMCGGVSALVAVFMTKVLSTVLGAAGACLVVAASFLACGPQCNVELWPGAPRFLGMGLVPFWCSMVLATALVQTLPGSPGARFLFVDGSAFSPSR